MSVHYKFKSTLDYDTITFDGLHISVADLKKAILQQKRLSKITDFDLQIINAQTKEEYQHDNSLIPKNTSLIISRVPLTQQAKKTWDTVAKPAPTRITSKAEGSGLDLSKMEGSEEDKIQAMMMQSTADYDPKSYQKIRGFSQTGDVPLTYRCNKCKKGGHWIKNCPYNISKEHTEVKRTTGIPKSFRDNDGRPIVFENQEPIMEEEKKQEIPEDLICSICHDLFVDAVMIPCCGSSFCDDCVRIALLESEDNECPDCKEKGTSPGSLIPNRFLRNSVNNFKNRTGYKPSNNERKGLQAPPAEVTNEIKESDKEKEKEIDIETETEKQIEKDNNETEDATENETLKHDPPAETETKPKQLPTQQPATETEAEQQSPTKDKEQHSTENSPVKVEKDTVEIKTEKPDNIVTSPIHDDSDYEDNIVVTVPSASETRTEKFLSRSRHSSSVRPSAIEQSSPKGKHSSQPQQISSYHQENNNHAPSESSSSHHSNRDWDKSHRDKPREHLEKSDHYMYEQKSSRSTALTSNPIENLQPPGGNNNPPVSTGPPMYPPMHTQSYDMPPRLIRPPMNMHPGFHNQMHRPPMYASHPNMPPHHHPAAGAHPQRMPNMNSPYDPAYNQMGNVAMGYPRFPPTNMPPNRFNYPMRESENHPNQMRPYNDIASVYEEVAAKVGVGIIDDPLEAFNRIMKEKEKKKDERRSPERRRRSKDRHISRGTFRSSPFNNRNPKDHGGGGGYHDKRARSRDRNDDRGGKWRHGKEDRHWGDRDRERDRERERDKEQGYRPRRSKSLERFSRSRSRSPNNNKRYRSPHPVNKPYGTNEKHHHNYYHHQGKPSRIEEYEEQSNINRNNRESNRNYVSLEPAKHMNEHLERRPTESRDMFSHPRRMYNMNDENSEPPPPGFEIPASRNPFHANNIVASPPPPLPVQIHGSSNNSNSNANNSNNNNRGIRNNTPDLYEKCVSQDLEDNKIYKPANKREQQKAEKKSRTRSRSRSKSSIKFEEKRRRLHRSTTPKGKPSDYHGSSSGSKRDKDKNSSGTAHSHAHAHAASEKYSKNDDSHKSSSGSSHKTSKDHHAHGADIQKSRRRSMTPPRETDESFNESLKAYKNAASDTQHTPEATQKKDKSLDESGKKEKKLKERKKKRKDKKESKKLKKEKKSKKERHRNKSEEKQKAVFIEDERQHYNSHDDNADNCIEVVELPEDDQNSHHSVVVLVDDKSNDLIKTATPQHNNNQDDDDDDDDVIFKAVDDDDDDDDGGMTPKHQQVIIDDDHQTPPSEIKCFDAVLDIHEYETDFDDQSFKLQDNNNAKLVPEASKWEIEEQSGTSAYINDDDDLAEVEENSMGSSVQEVKVTNDVIVRAEKAIFARAINAIRPIELHTKKSSSKDKSYSVDDVSDAGGNMKNIQITLPVTIGSSSSSSSNKERRRSVELRMTGESSGERKKSIKERLGSKIDQEQQQQVELHRREERYNRAKSPKQITEISRDGERYQRAESKKSDRNYRERDAEKTTAASRDKREKNDGSSGKTKEKERERERERAREREREREKEKERVRKRERDSEPEDRNSRRFSKNRDSKIKSDRGHHHHHHQQQQHSNEKKHSPIRHKRDPSSSSTSSWNTESESEERKRRQEKAERKAAAAAHKRSESTESDSKKSSKKKSKSDKKKRKKSKK